MKLRIFLNHPVRYDWTVSAPPSPIYEGWLKYLLCNKLKPAATNKLGRETLINFQSLYLRLAFILQNCHHILGESKEVENPSNCIKSKLKDECPLEWYCPPPLDLKIPSPILTIFQVSLFSGGNAPEYAPVCWNCPSRRLLIKTFNCNCIYSSGYTRISHIISIFNFPLA